MTSIASGERPPEEPIDPSVAMYMLQLHLLSNSKSRYEYTSTLFLDTFKVQRVFLSGAYSPSAAISEN